MIAKSRQADCAEIVAAQMTVRGWIIRSVVAGVGRHGGAFFIHVFQVQAADGLSLDRARPRRFANQVD